MVLRYRGGMIEVLRYMLHGNIHRMFPNFAFTYRSRSHQMLFHSLDTMVYKCFHYPHCTSSYLNHGDCLEFIIILLLLLAGGILLVDISVPACSGELGHKLVNSALILLVLWVFASSDLLSKPCAGLEENQVRSGTNTGPVVNSVRVPAAPLIKTKPDGLLGKEVRVSTESPQTRAAEATVQFRACILWWDLGRLLI